MIAPDARPKLAPKAKLRMDHKSGKKVLLYPEKGLVLNATGAAIVELCTGEHTVADIVARLAETYSQGSGEAGAIEADVQSFLQALADRGLLLGTAP